MNMTIQAVYQKGVLKPLRKLNLPEDKRVTLQLADSDDIPADLISLAADKSRAYDFLNDESEDIYSAQDGKPV